MTETTTFPLTEAFDSLLRPWNYVHDTLTETFGIPSIFVTFGMGIFIFWFLNKFLRFFFMDLEFCRPSFFSRRSMRRKMRKPKIPDKQIEKENEITFSQKLLSSLGLVKIKRVE